jgi:hypothetical protein
MLVKNLLTMNIGECFRIQKYLFKLKTNKSTLLFSNMSVASFFQWQLVDSQPC